MVYSTARPGRAVSTCFRELYESIAYLDPGFLQLKVLELLMLLGRVPPRIRSRPVLLSQSRQSWPGISGIIC